LRWPSACTSARAASPVLLTACALLPRCRQPQLRAVGLDGHRALDISATTGRRDVDTMFTRIRPSSRPRALPHGPGGAKPLPVIRARSSSRLRPRRRTARPAHHQERPRRLRPGHRRHDSHSKHHRGFHAGAASRHGSNTSPPLAQQQPTLTSTALACIYTARTTHSRHRLPFAARFHSIASTPPPVPQLTRFSCLAQPSQDKTFSSPTAVGETFGSSYQLHEDNNASAAAGKGATHDEPLAVRTITARMQARRPRPAGPSTAPSLPRGRLRPPRDDRPCLQPLRGMSTPRSRALRMTSRPSDDTLQYLAHRRIVARRPPRRSHLRRPNRTRRSRASSPRSMAILGRSTSATRATHRSLLPSR
jgi:hypothetical protein